MVLTRYYLQLSQNIFSKQICVGCCNFFQLQTSDMEGTRNPWLQMNNEADVSDVLRNRDGNIGPVPKEKIDFAARAVCRIELKENNSWRKQGSGFLLEVHLNNQHNLKGLLTNNHVINKKDYKNESLSCELIFEGLQNGKKGKLRVQLPLGSDETYFFTSDKIKMDATFIQMPQHLIDELERENAVWLTIHYANAKEGEKIFILQHPAIIANRAAALGIGRVSEFVEMQNTSNPFRILKHTVDTECGSSGSPVINFNGELIGLHRCAFDDGYNGATEARCIRDAMNDNSVDGPLDESRRNSQEIQSKITKVFPRKNNT